VDLGDSPWLLWLALALVAGTVEVLSLNLIFLMIAGGGFAAAVVAAFGLGVPVQAVVFAVVTGLLLVAARPPLLGYIRRSLPASATNTAALIGQDAEVVVAVTPTNGRIKLAGEIWSARSVAGGYPLEVGSAVQVVRIDGATAVVAPLVNRAEITGAAPPEGPHEGQ
jgi:membrane protein implicated in regulation of membrane protease activity